MTPPPTFDDVLGQDHAIGLLNDAMASGRIHHAWIFHGPQGVGKFTTAMAFASALLDPTTKQRADGRFAPESGSRTQQMIGADSHPDLFVVRKELATESRETAIRSRKQTTIPREVIDEFLVEPAHVKRSVVANSMKARVFIVDEAEMLARGGGRAAQNALLKTLEEPPEGVVIILVSTSDEALLPTIRSRCQRVAFRALDDDAMSAWQKESGLKTKDQWVLDFAAGSPGRLAMALETNMKDWGATLEPLVADVEKGAFSHQLGESMGAIVEDWAKEWEKNHPGASKDAANKSGASHLLSMLEERARRRLRAATQKGESLDEPLRWISLIEESRRQIDANVNHKQALQNLGAQLARADRGPSRIAGLAI